MDRVRPGALRPYFTTEDWIQLANDIDTALWPVVRFIRLRNTVPTIGILLFLYGIVTIVRSILGNNWYYNYNDQVGVDRYTLGFFICSASIGFMMVTMIVLNIYKTACLESQVQHSLENVLQQFSDDNQGGRITAHLIQQQHDPAVIVYHVDGNRDYSNSHALTGNYLLEISIDDHYHHHHRHKEQQQQQQSYSSDYHCLDEDEQQPARPPKALTTSAMTVRQRLERLDQVRDALSDEEYQDRRRIILDEL
jgi:hypothetical protein